MPTKMFDLRIEVVRTNGGRFTAMTILGNNAILFANVKPQPSIADAICEMICEMDISSGISMICTQPSLTQDFIDQAYSGNNSVVPKAVPTSKPATRNFTTGPAKQKYTGPLQRAVDIPLDMPKGECEDRCSNYDMFGAAKCSNFCPTRK